MRNLFNEIEQLYDVTNLKLVKNLGGFNSNNFYITNEDEDFVLKQYLYLNQNEVNQLEKISFFLDCNNIPVKLPLLNKSNSHNFKYQGSLYALYHMIEGTILHEDTINDTALIQASNIIAQLHGISNYQALNLPNYNSDSNNYSEAYSEGKRLASMNAYSSSPVINNNVRRLISLKLSLLDKLKGFNFNIITESKTLIHGDFHNENLIFNSSYQLVKLLDFEYTCIGSRTIDIFEFIYKACFNTGFANENINKAKKFLTRYRTLTNITNDEIYQGFYYYLLQLISSFYFEEKLLTSLDSSFYSIVERDLLRLQYLKLNHQSFYNSIIN